MHICVYIESTHLRSKYSNSINMCLYIQCLNTIVIDWVVKGIIFNLHTKEQRMIIKSSH